MLPLECPIARSQGGDQEDNTTPSVPNYNSFEFFDPRVQETYTCTSRRPVHVQLSPTRTNHEQLIWDYRNGTQHKWTDQVDFDLDLVANMDMCVRIYEHLSLWASTSVPFIARIVEWFL